MDHIITVPFSNIFNHIICTILELCRLGPMYGIVMYHRCSHACWTMSILKDWHWCLRVAANTMIWWNVRVQLYLLLGTWVTHWDSCQEWKTMLLWNTTTWKMEVNFWICRSMTLCSLYGPWLSFCLNKIKFRSGILPFCRTLKLSAG